MCPVGRPRPRCIAIKLSAPAASGAQAYPPRTPSSAGWKMKRIVPRSFCRADESISASARPTAACPSCPQECESPALTEAKPSAAGRCEASALSAVSTQSMSKRMTVSGPHPQRSSAQRPVYSPMRESVSAGAPCSSARRFSARASAARPMTRDGSINSSAKRTLQPSRASTSAHTAVVRNSAQPRSGYLWKSRRRDIISSMIF